VDLNVQVDILSWLCKSAYDRAINIATTAAICYGYMKQECQCIVRMGFVNESILNKGNIMIKEWQNVNISKEFRYVNNMSLF